MPSRRFRSWASWQSLKGILAVPAHQSVPKKHEAMSRYPWINGSLLLTWAGLSHSKLASQTCFQEKMQSRIIKYKMQSRITNLHCKRVRFFQDISESRQSMYSKGSVSKNIEQWKILKSETDSCSICYQMYMMYIVQPVIWTYCRQNSMLGQATSGN